MIGRLIDGRYQVRSRIARGGMATVYLATDLRLERRVAIKIMHGHLADDSQFKQRFIQEARSAARLAHPNVVNVFDQGQDQESAYLVMEYLPGITLRDLLHDYGALTSEQTLDITEAVLAGLAAAHKAGIVHRDLKPENVLLADDGRIKIGDFGLARAASANTATGAALLGTIAYLSPELVTRGVADTRSDIYAVGIMMYEMLTGEQPYKGEQPMAIAYQHANDSVPTPSSLNPRVPAELDELVLWATARDPEERPRDARALLDQVHDTESLLQTALPQAGATAQQRTMVLPSAPERQSAPDAATEVLGARGPSTPAPPVSDSTAALTTVARKRRTRRWIPILLVLLLVAAAGTAGWYFGIGPGARVEIPASIRALPPDEARAQLTALGLVVADENGQVNSLDVQIDLVAETAPAIGTSLAKGETVQLLVSIGPRLLPLPAFAGQDEATATTLVDASWSRADPFTVQQFDGTVPEGTVIQALGSQGEVLAEGAQYAEQAPIQLILSAGPLPAVEGISVADAEDALRDAGLTVGEPSRENSETVGKDAVIRIALTEGQVVRVDDTVSLVVSDGPPPVQIPEGLIGKTWKKVRDDLKGLGLVPKITNGGAVPGLAEFNPTAFRVVAIEPAEGATTPKGSEVKVTLEFTG